MVESTTNQVISLVNRRRARETNYMDVENLDLEDLSRAPYMVPRPIDTAIILVLYIYIYICFDIYIYIHTNRYLL